MTHCKQGPAAVNVRPVHRILLVLALANSPAHGGVGEDGFPAGDPLSVGMRVRIHTLDPGFGKIVGVIDSVSDEKITIEADHRRGQLSVLREKIAGIEVSSGRRARWVDCLIGAAIGGASGALIGSTQKSHGSTYAFTQLNEGADALLGIFAGALIGAAIPPGEHWKDLTGWGSRVNVAPSPDHGMGISIRFGF